MQLTQLDDTHRLAAQMLRVLFRAAAADRTSVDTPEKAAAVLRDPDLDFHVRGCFDWGGLLADERAEGLWAEVREAGLAAEPLAVAMFFDVFWVPDHCGHQGCCGPLPLSREG